MATRPRILVIDDEEDLRTSVADVLRILMDADVVEASGGAEAIRMHQQAPADMVVVDYRMPQMNGLDTTAALRAITPGVGVVLFTAFHDTKVLDEARLYDVDVILPKPSHAEELLAAVAAVLQRSTGRTGPPAASPLPPNEAGHARV